MLNQPFDTQQARAPSPNWVRFWQLVFAAAEQLDEAQAEAAEAASPDTKKEPVR